MDRIVSFSKKFYLMMALMAIMISFSLDAQQSMSLGALRFVMPSSQVEASSRKLSMKMAMMGISPKFIAKVGGVAFIQTATPDFKINSFDLGVDYERNKAYAIINDTIYDIPLEVWELQSIVDYASTDDNAAVTLFGPVDNRIQFHEAFLDNLMGWRLLQTDLMFSGILKKHDKAMLPSYGNKDYVLSRGEALSYQQWSDKYSIDFHKSYEETCVDDLYQVEKIIDKFEKHHNSYIYTDYDQPILFKRHNGNIEFNGEPYYRFVTNNRLFVDTIEMYYEIRNYIDTFNIRKERFKNSSISNIFNKSENQLIYKLMNITKNKKAVRKNATSALELTQYYAKYDSIKKVVDDLKDLYNSYGISDLGLSDASIDNFIVVLKGLDNQNRFKALHYIISNYAVKIVKNGSDNNKLLKLCHEFCSIKDSLITYNDYPILAAYANLMHEMAPTGSVSLEISELSDNLLLSSLSLQKLLLFDDNPYSFGLSELVDNQLNYEELLIDYMCLNKIAIPEIMLDVTEYFRRNSDLVYNMNPIVFSAAIKVCHWSSFFRFVKDNYKDEWFDFKERINKLEYDAPKVQTPIDCYYSY